MGDVRPGDEGWLGGLADRFGRAWGAGQRPRIEDYLGDATGPRRSRLLEELVRVERRLRIADGETPRPDEYLGRLPGDGPAIDAAFAPASRPGAARATAGAGRDLLFGLLALQNDFIGRDELLAAFAARVADKSRPLGRALLEAGALDADTHALLEALVVKHLALHGDDPGRSLASLSSLGSTRDALAAVDDPDLRASLDRVATDRDDDDPEATRPHVGGRPTHGGGRPGRAGPRFRVLRFHARGGLGRVSVARDEELHREVALKEIQDRFAHDPQSRSRFVAEAEITGNLEHPGIIPVYGLGTYDDGRPFYAMRFIKGDSSLKDAIERLHAGGGPQGRALELRNLVRRLLDVCLAMAYAHSRGVLHRDLKPHNILLGPYGETLVVDWGLAKSVGRPEGADGGAQETLHPGSADPGDATRPGTHVGTPGYMSPEQAAGELDRLGPASDVYGLGAILYCLLTGRAAFEGRDLEAVLAKVRRGEFPPPRAVAPGTDRALEAVCLKAMATRPEDRYGSPRGLADDLERWLADEPVSAWREPWTARARRWRSRHRPLVAAATAAAAVGLVAAAWGWKRSEVQAAKEKTRGESLAQAILAAEIGKVPPLVEQLEGYRRWAAPRLVPHLVAGRDDSPEKLRAALALVPVDGRQVDYLYGRLLRANAEELLVIREALRPSGPALAPRLWARLEDAKAGPDDRLRAAAALAAYDPDDSRWRAHGTLIVDRLVKEDPQVLRSWTEAFRPARSALVDRLAAASRDRGRPEAERALAENMFLAYADRPEDLTVLVQSADPPLFDVLVARLAKSPDRAVALLRQALAQAPRPRWEDPDPDPAWATPDPGLAARFDRALGWLAERFALCQTMPLDEFVEVAEGLRGSGYRPIRVRPYRAADAVRVAAVWARDGRPWRMTHGAGAEAVVAMDGDARRRGYRAVDAAGYPAAGVGERPPGLAYAAVWAASLGPDDVALLDVDVAGARFPQVRAARGKSGFVLDARSIAIAPDGQPRSCAVWAKGDESLNRREVYVGNQAGFALRDVAAKLLLDVGLCPEPSQDPKQAYTPILEQAGQVLAARPGDLAAAEARGRARFYLGQYEGAVADLTRVIDGKKGDDQTFLRRSRAHACLGRSEEARRDLAEYLERRGKGPDDDPQATWAGAAVACSLGQDEEGFRRLEGTLAAHPGDNEFRFYAACAYAEASRAITTKGYADRAVQLLREAVADGFNRYNDFFRIKSIPEIDAIRAHPGYRALMFPAGYDRRVAALWHESKALESQEVHGLAPPAHLERCREWAAQGYRPAAIAVVAAGDDLPTTSASIWHRPLAPPEARLELLRRQGQAAAALVRLGRPDLIWPLLRHAPDPSLRTEIIHGLARFDSGSRNLQALVERLGAEPDASARRALALALGEFPPPATQPHRRALTPRLLSWYRDDPDPGVHSAVGWLLREKWGLGGEVARIDRECSGMGLPGDRDWFVNTEGQALAIVRGPATFAIGSPANEDGHTAYEAQHRVRIGRSFAIATKEVTDAQYKRSIRGIRSPNPLLDEVPRAVDWYAAARYCNWLSQRELIPEDQWCYPRSIEPGMILPPDHLGRTGYRLPTEAEWEYACRAGTTTGRHLGSGDLWLGRYAWCYETASGKHSGRPVGQLKPNDLGLFDVLGNVEEWAQNPFDLPVIDPEGRAATDSGFARLVDATSYRVSRGGGARLAMTQVRSATRFPVAATNASVGFRVARTYHPRDPDAVIADYREAIRRKPEDVATRMSLALVLAGGGRFDAAIAEYREAIRLNPNFTGAYVALAGALWDGGRPDEMVAVLGQAVERQPDSAALRHRHALALLLAGDREGYRRASVAASRRLGGTAGGGGEAARAFLLTPDALDDFSVPVRLAEAAAAASADMVNLYILGLARHRAGQHEPAIRDLGASLDADPHWHAHALTRLVLAMAHHRLGHAEEARRWLEKAHDPRGGEAWAVKPGEVLGATAPWWDRGDYQILRLEADELILKSARPVGPPPP